MKSKRFPVAAAGCFAALACVLFYWPAFAQTAPPAPSPSPFVWPPTAATWLLFWPLITAVISLFYNKLDTIPRVHAVLSALVKVGVDLPGLLADLKRVLTGVPTPAAAAKLAARLTKPLAVLALLALAASQTACGLSSAPVVPVTPQNAAQVASCQSSATWHNDSLVTGIVFGAVGTGAGTIAAADNMLDQNGKTGLAVTAAVSAAVAGGAAAVAELSGSNFANGRCTDVVGPLPARHLTKDASAWPADWPAPTVSATDDVDTANSVLRAAGAQ